MTGDEATAFAARITAAIDYREHRYADDLDSDHERVVSDLAGYLRALDGLADVYEPHLPMEPGDALPARAARHARRYTAERDDRLAGLTRTGTLYGVTL